MAFWEFLIQKEGDRSWLPLESPTVEILEGRYRVVARSNRVHAPVEIRVIQNAATETPPIRRIQKRLSQTNQDGLMVVIPFTRLLPGEWELRCASDVMSDMMGEGWLYKVQLQVQPIDLEADDEILDHWEADWQREEPSASEEIPAPVSATDPEQAALSPEASSEIPSESSDVWGTDDRSLENRPTHPQTNSRPDNSLDNSSDDSSDKPFRQLGSDRPPVLQLSLEQETYVVKRGLPLVLAGQLLPPAEPPESSEPPELALSAGGKLRVRLFDPQTSKMLVDETQPLAAPLDDRWLPSPFSLSIGLPTDCETHLLLGELALYGSSEAGLPPVLATQSFSVTSDLLELLEAIANDFSEPEAEPVAKPVSAPVVMRSPSPSIQFRLSVPQPLPPLLHQPDPEKEPRRSLQLPTLSNPTAEEMPPETAAQLQPEVTPQPETPDPTDAPVPAASASQEPEPEVKAAATQVSDQASETQALEAKAPETQAPSPHQPQLQLTDDLDDPAIDWQKVEPHVPLWQRQPSPSDLPQTPEDSAFRALNLRERFLERLQALASDSELADWLNAMAPIASDGSDSEEAALVSRRADQRNPGQQNPGQRNPDHAIGLDADLAAQEIVVDEPFFMGDRQPSSERSSERSSEQQVAPLGQTGFSEPVSGQSAAATLTEEPIATPELDVPTGELISGQTVNIGVKIPNTYGRIYVKLWSHDRQSRTLLDGPHWLMDFNPDGFGNLVSKTQLMVPFGCVEVQLEAIAIDMATQIESNKVSVIRSVIPPSLTALSMDELGGL
ncbi:MAG: hypothetical protein HY785_20970 [Oscillatoriophycideae cyanobacterium NC_groundwater_1537_Pr4_S-0.65um_50_18]|nr:hypothetical protein [Oscillatoriophycideae cyanobacterium NC_groundwater_1537_Pr4_S-0.65um_50_18]